jgi:hypothetical protein
VAGPALRSPTSIDRDLDGDGRRHRLCSRPSATAALGVARDQPRAARGWQLCLRDCGPAYAHMPRVRA